jgi:hypothetical protein
MGLGWQRFSTVVISSEARDLLSSFPPLKGKRMLACA